MIIRKKTYLIGLVVLLVASLSLSALAREPKTSKDEPENIKLIKTKAPIKNPGLDAEKVEAIVEGMIKKQCLDALKDFYSLVQDIKLYVTWDVVCTTKKIDMDPIYKLSNEIINQLSPLLPKLDGAVCPFYSPINSGINAASIIKLHSEDWNGSGAESVGDCQDYENYKDWEKWVEQAEKNLTDVCGKSVIK